MADSIHRVIVGLSGGVDSSVAALRLLEQGYAVEALFMKNWEEDDDADYCAAADDLADAKAVAERLGIRLHTVNFATEYWDRVFEYFLAEYRAGRTPNPDVMCNQEIKFKAFLDHAVALGADAIATGHYARIGHAGDGLQLLTGRDPTKDQSYFLYTLGQAQLRRTLFPVGALPKAEVRALAEYAGLATARKKDSTGICFIGERKFRDFLQRYLPAQPGTIVTPEGHAIGEHAGLMFYTIGQRHGIGVGGRKDAGDAPWFVTGKDLARNHLIVAQGHDHPLLLCNTLTATQATWIAATPPPWPLRCSAKIRYRQVAQPCTVETCDSQVIVAHFDTAQRAITPGQSVVFYQGEVCLGGAVIDAPAPGAT